MIVAKQMSDLIDALYQGNDDIAFQGAAIDSRKITKGQLFVAIKGEKVDGHDYLQVAKDNGATCALVERFQAFDIAQIKVEDTVAALALIAKFYRNSLTATVIGVTGSNGKTSMKEMIASLLSANCQSPDEVFKTPGNLNNHIGLPMSILNIDDSKRYAVLEMGMSALGEINALTNIAHPKVAIITNAMPAHLLGLKKIENIITAKGEIFNGLDQDGIAVINANSEGYDVWHKKLEETHQNRTTLSYQLLTSKEAVLHASADVKGYVTETFETGQKMAIEIDGHWHHCFLPLIGTHNAENCLGAIAVVSSLGIKVEAIIEAVASIKMVQGRTRLVKGVKQSKVIDDSYNANPGSMKAACKTLASINSKHKILVMGNMAELGDDEKQWHKTIGAFAKEQGIHQLMAFGNLCQYACDGFGENAKHYETKSALIADLLSIINHDCAVLVKGSNSMGMTEIVNAIEEKTNRGSQ